MCCAAAHSAITGYLHSIFLKCIRTPHWQPGRLNNGTQLHKCVEKIEWPAAPSLGIRRCQLSSLIIVRDTILISSEDP